MESICSFCLLRLFLTIAMILCLKGKIWDRRTKKLPPGPPGWPIIGNIFDLGTEPHRALQELKLKNIEDDTAAANARGESECKDGYEFFQATGMAAMWAGTPNVADFLPFLKWFDPQGLRRNMSRDMARALKIVEGFVKERLEEYKLGNEEKNNKDFLDT
ncbi:hypothetical protein GH714_026467 [Hevea brasiliensis]|uniref:Cytochrome P450 n=1 Tax=Hevea brasiliensis TaxID=3981 RepID=A0A6A6N6S4_HEVBR|nr:hypothetical protein GH714_026467 [Hevea brasiliensis]